MKLEYCKKNTYNIFDDDGDEIIIPFTNILAPFGEEEFKKKRIINFELEPKKENDTYNILAYVESLESELLNDSYFSEMENKSPLKKRYPKKPLLRVHINDDSIEFINKGVYSGNIKLEKVWIWRKTMGIYISIVDLK